MTIELIALVASRAFFSASEWALVRSSRVETEYDAVDGETLERYLRVCQLGSISSTLGAGWYLIQAVVSGAWFNATSFEPGWLSVALDLASVGIFAAVYVVFAIELPRYVVLRFPRRGRRALLWPIRALDFLIYPVISVQNKALKALARRFIG